MQVAICLSLEACLLDSGQSDSLMGTGVCMGV